MKLYECHDCQKVLESDCFYWTNQRNKRRRMSRCKECELTRRASRVEYHVNELHNATKRRCKRKGLKFKLTKAWYREKLNKSCELSGLPFEFQSKKKKRSPRAASVDRIDPAKGYTEENCRMVCICLNYLFGSWKEEAALGVVFAYLRNRGFKVNHDD